MPDDPTAAAPIQPRPGAMPLENAPDGGPVGAIQAEIIRQSIDAIIITDPGLAIVTWNPAAVALYGIPAEDAIGRRMADLLESLDPAGRPLNVLEAREVLGAKGGWQGRVIHRPRTGSRAGQDVSVDSLVTLLRDPDGDPVGALGVNRDVSGSARLEAELAALGSLVVATGNARTRTEVAQAAIEILCRTTGADAGLVTSTDGLYEAAARHGVGQALVDVIVGFGKLGGPLAQALQAPAAYVSADIATAPLREDVRAAVLDEGVEHLVVVGLRLADRLIGILALGWRQRAPIEPSRAIMHQAAALVAASMENARLIEAVASGLAEERLLTRRMRALVELTRLPEAAGVDRGDWDRFVSDVGSVIGADATVFGRKDGERLALAGVSGIDVAFAQRMMDRPVADVPIAAQLVAGGSSVLVAVDGGQLTELARAAFEQLGYPSLAAFAIRDDGALVGIVFAMFRRRLADLEIDERTLDAIGRVLDISFANRRLREIVTAGERRYRDLFEASPDALLVEGPELVVAANQAARELFGEGIEGRPVDQIFVADRAIVDREALGPGGVSGLVGTGRRLDGTTFPEEVDLRPIQMDGQPGTLAIVRDLTERSRLQAELVQAQKMEAIGMLVAGVAHELNNPLASIVAFSQLIRTDPGLPVDLRRQADLLIQESNRTKVIVQNLLDFARQRPPERAESELRPLVDSVISLQSYIFSRNRLEVEIDIPRDLPRLAIDRSQIQQVLINLTVNAAQAIQETGRPGRIRVEARSAATAAGPTVRISIKDDGPGVADAMRDRLFVPFATTKEPGQGTGLGLSVSFGIVAGHGGTLHYAPNPGGGSIFTIELPVGRPSTPASPAIPPVASRPAPPPGATDLPSTTAPRPDETGDRADGDLRAATAARPAGAPPRVLVLDDEPSIREFLSRVLVRHGYEPVLARTGQAAIEIVRSDPPAAILCDHRMAGMNGTEFHAAVSAIDPVLGRRFAFMSGDVLNPELHDFATANRVQLLAKPFDIATVGTLLGRLLGDEG